ncbi:MAG: hypothetical protein HY344_04065 [Candidatus Levybacteria bacterium]|nr:hypothetical protein [Candidatus Levybacteria bacterium]
MTQIKIDFKNLLRGYDKKGWVAISSDHKKVVYHGKTLKSVMAKSKKNKDKLFYFPSGEKYSNFVG